MSRRGPDVLRDPEVLELLRDDPELLAIADAIHSTLGAAYRRRRRRARTARLAAVALVLVAAAASALLVPWTPARAGIVERALGAIGGRPVVHAVLETEVPGDTLVDLASGRRRPDPLRVELWFDGRRSLLHSVFSAGGVVVGDFVTNPRKSLETSGKGRAALVAFAADYRAALRSGDARVRAGGSRVDVLEIRTRFGDHELVTIDARTFRPLFIRPLGPDGRPTGVRSRVVRIESVPFARADFARRASTTRVAIGGGIASAEPVGLAAARTLLGRPALWSGRRLDGLLLRAVRRERLHAVYAAGHRRIRRRADGLELLYGRTSSGLDGRYVRLQEARAPEPAYGFVVEPPPPDGLLRLERSPIFRGGGRALWVGRLHVRGLWVVLSGSSRALVTDAARRLTRLP